MHATFKPQQRRAFEGLQILVRWVHGKECIVRTFQLSDDDFEVDRIEGFIKINNDHVASSRF